MHVAHRAGLLVLDSMIPYEFGMRRRQFLLGAALIGASLTSAACSSRQPWTITPAQSGGVSIIPVSAYFRGGKLWARANLLNGTGKPIVIDRDAITCVLQSGAIIGRASGSATIHTPYDVQPGGSHAVYVEFEGDFFRGASSATVDFSRAVTVDGQTIGAPKVFLQNAAPE
jgi:hypothetical protein